MVPPSTPKGRPAEVVGLDSRQLLTRHRNGDPNAFPELMSMYRATVYSYLRRCGFDHATCDDLFQDSFLAVHRAAASYDATRPLTPWILTIVVNTTRSHLRKTPRTEELHDVHEDGNPSPRHEYEAAETAAFLGGAIRELAPIQQEIVALCSLQGIEQEEAARILGIPLNTLKTHLRRARIRLAEALALRSRNDSAEVKS